MRHLIVCFLFSFVKLSLAANILCIFPKPAFSHQKVFRSVTEGLLNRGHRITLLTTHPSETEKQHANITLIDVSFSSEIFQETLDKAYESKSIKEALFQIIDDDAALVDMQLSSEGFQKLLNNKLESFDLLFLETSGASPFHALAEIFKVPIVGITSSDAFSVVHGMMGNENNAIAHPDRLLHFTMAKTFLQRLGSCAFNLMIRIFILPRSEQNFDALLRKHFPSVEKSHAELLKNVDLLFINAHPAFGFIRPILPNTIPLGFLHVKPPSPLPDDLKELLDNSKHGAIFMSFGTIVTSKLAHKSFESFMKAFTDLPYNIFWKYDGEIPDQVPTNIHFRKWFPQSDLLAHPNVRLFITQGVSENIQIN